MLFVGQYIVIRLFKKAKYQYWSLPHKSNVRQALLQISYLCDKLSKTQRYLVYFLIRQRKAGNPPTGEAGARENLAFLLQK